MDAYETDYRPLTEDEIQDHKISVKTYIETGDELHQPYDLRGLSVFATIQALRELNEVSDPGEPEEKLQTLRREIVEAEVDAAVEHSMQYYDFGGNDQTYRYDVSFVLELLDYKKAARELYVLRLDKSDNRALDDPDKKMQAFHRNWQKWNQ